MLENRKGRRRRKKKKSNNYFNQDTENAIIAFQAQEDLEKKKKIFVDDIRPAFTKLIENIIFVYKFHTMGNIEVLKNDCLSFLFETIVKFDATKGHKAFSYFNVIAKHWFIQRVKNYKKRTKSDVHFDRTMLSKLEKNNNQAVVISYEDILLKKEYFGLLKGEIRKWRGKFDKEQEKKVLEAVILLLDNPDELPIYNKKAIYLYIRNMTDLNTKQIVTNLAKLKKKYKFFKGKYFNGEI